MATAKRKNQTVPAAWKLEGQLFLPDQLQKVFLGKADYQAPVNYDIEKGLEIRNECARAWQIALARWQEMAVHFERSGLTPARRERIVQTFIEYLLGRSLEFNITKGERVTLGERTYPIPLRASGIPVVVCDWQLDLDQSTTRFVVEGGSARQKSAFQFTQEYLNASAPDLWAMVTNGKAIRLLRDSTSLTRPTFLEFDLESMFTGQQYAEFANLWRTLHGSRAKIHKDANGNPENIWEHWRSQGVEEGARVRDSLRDNVTDAIALLGQGFLKTEGNEALHQALASGALTPHGYLQELLRLMYRLIFVFCLEERQLINTPAKDDASRKARQRYANGYALHRFREQSIKRRFINEFKDAWQSVKIVFKGLSRGETRLALPALGGLFAEHQCQHLDSCELENRYFIRAMRQLRWANIDGQQVPIDYKDMGTEELGSVYESLLELVPVVDAANNSFSFVGVQTDFTQNEEGSNAGNQRKSTGSYYTPDVLVQSLIETALEPVIEARMAEQPETPEKALLSLRVIDPACGSGHFLLAAARRIAEKLADVRSGNEAVTPEIWRQSLRDVISLCVYGVDLNPMAIELARMALWLESYQEDRPLSFLDEHLRVGNSLLGIFKLEDLQKGIAKDAYKVCEGDDKETCKTLNKANATALKQALKAWNETSPSLELEDDVDLSTLTVMPARTLGEAEAQAKKYRALQDMKAQSRLTNACNLVMAAYLSPKNDRTKGIVPDTATLFAQLGMSEANQSKIPHFKAMQDYARRICKEQQVFHWPLEFPEIFRDGGFDCVLGNPPWEKAKIADKEWFASRYPAIADAQNANARKKMLEKLAIGELSAKLTGVAVSEVVRQGEINLYNQYLEAKRQCSTATNFQHLDDGRFPLTGTGDTNLYAYFSELALNLKKPDGRVGFVVPTGIMTDNATKAFAQTITDGQLASFYDFENAERLFPIHRSYRFSLLTLGKAPSSEFVFYATNPRHLDDANRRVQLTADDIRRMNPNTRTAVVIRSKADLELLRKIYARVPVLINETVKENGNPWNIRFMRMFDMSNDSNLFHNDRRDDDVPLYEGKLIHQFDNRYATFELDKKGKLTNRDVRLDEKQDPAYTITPQYWVSKYDVEDRFVDKKAGFDEKGFPKKFWNEGWMFAFRDIARGTDQRTLIASVICSHVGAGNKAPLIFPNETSNKSACLLANLNSLIADYCIRLKQTSANVNLYILRQIPILPPTAYSQEDLDFIVPRVAQLTRNSDAISSVWLTDYPQYTFQLPEERLRIRAELDAYYGRQYGLTRDEMRFVLDPADVYGDDYPSITFPGLRDAEIRQFGEYLTKRLVMETWDKLEAGTLK